MVAAKLIVKGGQSNSEGDGRVSALPPGIPQIVPRVSTWSRIAGAMRPLEVGKSLAFDGQSVDPNAATIEEGNVFGTELRLGVLAHQHFPKEDIFILKCGRGGTVLTNLIPGLGTINWHPTTVGSYFDEMLSAIEACRVWILANYPAYPTVEIQFVEWIHGESDGAFNPYAGQYAGNLEDLIYAFRERCAIGSHAPWIVVKPATSLSTATPVAVAQVATVRAGMDTVASTVPKVHTWDADGRPTYTYLPPISPPYDAENEDPWNNWSYGISKLHYVASSVDTIARGVWETWDSIYGPSAGLFYNDEFDIQAEEPWSRTRERMHVSHDGAQGVSFSRQLDERPVDIIEIPIKNSNPAKTRRLRELWNRTYFGTVPMKYVHPEAGVLLVVFDDPEEVEQYLSARRAQTVVRLRVWKGGYR